MLQGTKELEYQAMIDGSLLKSKVKQTSIVAKSIEIMA
jgi:hypothetical protein